MKTILILLFPFVSICFVGCGGSDIKTKLSDASFENTLAHAKETKLMLDTQLMVAKFNSMQIDALSGMVTYRFKNRDSLMYYLGQADAFSKARKMILK
jgi:hypothetical protein